MSYSLEKNSYFLSFCLDCVLQCITVYYSVLQCITVYYSVLLCITVYYSVLQFSYILAIVFWQRENSLKSNFLYQLCWKNIRIRFSKEAQNVFLKTKKKKNFSKKTACFINTSKKLSSVPVFWTPASLICEPHATNGINENG